MQKYCKILYDLFDIEQYILTQIWQLHTQLQKHFKHNLSLKTYVKYLPQKPVFLVLTYFFVFNSHFFVDGSSSECGVNFSVNPESIHAGVSGMTPVAEHSNLDVVVGLRWWMQHLEVLYRFPILIVLIAAEIVRVRIREKLWSFDLY